MKKWLIILLLYCSNANALELGKYYKEPLTDVDKANIVVFNVLQGIDMLQTLEIANNDAYYEKNKIFALSTSVRGSL